jgi:hypothetical protein
MTILWAVLVLVLGAVPAVAQGLVGNPQDVINQASYAVAIGTSDTVDFSTGPTRGIYNGNATACAIAVMLRSDSSAVTLSNIQPGSFLPLRVKRVMTTNTTCTGIIGLW